MPRLTATIDIRAADGVLTISTDDHAIKLTIKNHLTGAQAAVTLNHIEGGLASDALDRAFDDDDDD